MKVKNPVKVRNLIWKSDPDLVDCEFVFDYWIIKTKEQ